MPQWQRVRMTTSLFSPCRVVLVRRALLAALVLRSADDSGLTRRSAGVRTARGDAREGAAFLQPAVGRKRAPAAGVEVRHLPADRLVLRVGRLVVVGGEIEAVPVGVRARDEAPVGMEPG